MGQIQGRLVWTTTSYVTNFNIPVPQQGSKAARQTHKQTYETHKQTYEVKDYSSWWNMRLDPSKTNQLYLPGMATLMNIKNIMYTCYVNNNISN